ncbi:hypothetical protein HU200_016452 [Digitaria exilis]|uniref:Dehydrin n=1 Tax=Digitaria exilis TaxID=1010633 RepID=A0A835EIF3_9POAL|nr:hypothetical protein HU200_039403 [Digitaria exilis]KAF8731392.1 hypothetical protein HU200_016452 [Digitaria exilis]CAB3504010.1 unnamed protein product [Digitaria exilis]
MEHQGQHVHATAGTEGYGNPVAAQPQQHGGQVMEPAAAEEQRSRGILHRSGSSSSSSSSEDDGMGGRRKKGLKEKIKEKLPGKNKDGQQTAAGGTAAYGQQGHAGTAAPAGHATAGTTEGEKKGVMDKIKEKLPGHH